MADIKQYVLKEPYLAVKNGLGEGPYYEEATKTIRWLDVPNGQVHTIDVTKGPSSHKILAKVDLPIGVTANIKGRPDAFLYAGKWSLGIMDKSTGKTTPIKESFTDDEKAQGTTMNLRFNDGSVDPQGRLWIGTMVDTHKIEEWTPNGTLYRIGPDLKLHRMAENASVPNGNSWTFSHKTMYWTDTMTHTIWSFDYNDATGEISNRSKFYEFDENGWPDGHAMDAEEHLWVALFFGSKVVRISPAGKIVAEIQLPTRCVTCPRFVGTQLFITTGQEMDPANHPESVAQGGNVFMVDVGVGGAPIYDFDMKA